MQYISKDILPYFKNILPQDKEINVWAVFPVQRKLYICAFISGKIWLLATTIKNAKM